MRKKQTHHTGKTDDNLSTTIGQFYVSNDQCVNCHLSVISPL